MARDFTPIQAAAPRPRRRGALKAAAVVTTFVLIGGALGLATSGLLGTGGRGSGAAGSGGTAVGSGGPGSSAAPGSAGAPATPSPVPTPAPSPTPPPAIGGTELYGYLPYWQMSARMATYLDHVPVTTLALFSVGVDGNGAVKTSDIGYRRITGTIGRGLIADAHARGQRVELVFTSFGVAQNKRLFTFDTPGQARRDRAVAGLLALAKSLGVDGIDVDVEQVQGDITIGYAAFMGELRAGLGVLGRHATLTAATATDHDGAEMARTAIISGADRVFLMGYNYHWSGSGAGASAPIQNRDPGLDLTQSIVDYVETGVPRNRILLGLPLYGMTWDLAGPDRSDGVLGKGTTWIPASHVSVLLGPGFAPTLDPIEVSEYFMTTDGTTFSATYYDSPRSLQPKLALARSQGLAGAGFWALGYEYGLPGYLDLMAAFRAGRIGG